LPSQQYRPIQYQGQNYQNFAATPNNAVGPSQTAGSGGGNMYPPSNQPYPGQSYGHQQPVPNPNYPNPSYGNPANQQYQNSPYANQPGNIYAQNVAGSQPQNFPPNYPPVGYVQQPASSSSTYGPGTNQPSSYTGYGNAPQITYVSSQTTQSAPSASTQTYPPPPNQSVPNAAVAVQHATPAPQPNYPAPQANAQPYQPPNNGPNQQPVIPQNYIPQQNYQPPPQGYPAPGQHSGYQPYPQQRPLAPPANQSPYPGYSYQQPPV